MEDKGVGSWTMHSLPGIEVIGALLDVGRSLAEQRSRRESGTWEVESGRPVCCAERSGGFEHAILCCHAGVVVCVYKTRCFLPSDLQSSILKR